MIKKKYKIIIAKKWKEQWLNRKSNVKELINFTKKIKKDISKLNFLDAWCAQGRDTKEISSYGTNIIWIDCDQNFIKEAKTKYPKIEFILWNIEKLPFKSESFDVVYCVNTLFYTNIKKSLLELARVLKKSGLLFITLDKNILNIDENIEIHSLDTKKTLKYLNEFDILYKDKRERTDKIPFKHKHIFNVILLQKKVLKPPLKTIKFAKKTKESILYKI